MQKTAQARLFNTQSVCECAFTNINLDAGTVNTTCYWFDSRGVFVYIVVHKFLISCIYGLVFMAWGGVGNGWATRKEVFMYSVSNHSTVYSRITLYIHVCHRVWKNPKRNSGIHTHT